MPKINIQKTEFSGKKNPPNAPWMGRAYERLIQTVKNAPKRYHEITLSDRQLITVFTEIEGIVNTPSLTYIDQEIDTKILTLNHFLQIKYPAIPLTVSGLNEQETANRLKVLQLWKKGK